MKAHRKFMDCCWFGILIALLLPVACVQANPISLPEKSITPEISFVISFAILLEVICIWWILRQSRRPRFFMLWLLGMHLFTYPAFLGLLWMLNDMRPAFAVALGEGLVVVVEGALIYLMCRFAPSPAQTLTAPSAVKCWLASFVGNAVSAIVFPMLLALYERFISA